MRIYNSFQRKTRLNAKLVRLLTNLKFTTILWSYRKDKEQAERLNFLKHQIIYRRNCISFFSQPETFKNMDYPV